MILIGLGANLPTKEGGPENTLEAALVALSARPDVEVVRRSRWYRTSAVGVTDQPDFVNGVAEIKTSLDPVSLLKVLLALEAEFGRERRERWGPRVLDLDIVDFDGLVGDLHEGALTLHLPHPRAHERGFVLYPLLELVPDWCHPGTGEDGSDLARKLDSSQKVVPFS